MGCTLRATCHLACIYYVGFVCACLPSACVHADACSSVLTAHLFAPHACHACRALPAPAPNNVNYPTLLRTWAERGSRPVFVFFFVRLMLLFPIGTFAGVCGTVVSAICGTVPDGGKATLSVDSSWFCSGAWVLCALWRSGALCWPGSSCADGLPRPACMHLSAPFAALLTAPSAAPRLLCPGLCLLPPTFCRRQFCKAAAQRHLQRAALHPAQRVAGSGAAHLVLHLCPGKRAGCRVYWWIAGVLRCTGRCAGEGEASDLGGQPGKGACTLQPSAFCTCLLCAPTCCTGLQAEAQHFSLSSLDLRCANWFFLVSAACQANRRSCYAAGSATPARTGLKPKRMAQPFAQLKSAVELMSPLLLLLLPARPPARPPAAAVCSMTCSTSSWAACWEGRLCGACAPSSTSQVRRERCRTHHPPTPPSPPHPPTHPPNPPIIAFLPAPRYAAWRPPPLHGMLQVMG